MKKIVFLFVCLLISAIAFGQDPLTIDKSVDEVKVTPPTFTGVKNQPGALNQTSDNFLEKYLMSMIEYPQRAVSDGAEGTEVIHFTITSEGKLKDFEVVNSISREVDSEVIWALQQTKGMWNPGYNNTTPVEMHKEVSLAFMSKNSNGESASEHFTEMATNYFSKGNTALFEKGNAKKAMRNYTSGIKYLPHDPSLLLMRGLCRYERGDKEGAIEDWDSGFEHGGIDMSRLETAQLKLFKGYYEMVAYKEK